MSRRSPRLVIARSVIEISKVLTRLRILRERAQMLLHLYGGRDERYREQVRVLLETIDSHISRLESVLERMRTLMYTEDPGALREVVRDLSTLYREASRDLSLEISGIENALEMLREIEAETRYV